MNSISTSSGWKSKSTYESCRRKSDQWHRNYSVFYHFTTMRNCAFLDRLSISTLNIRRDPIAMYDKSLRCNEYNITSKGYSKVTLERSLGISSAGETLYQINLSSWMKNWRFLCPNAIQLNAISLQSVNVPSLARKDKLVLDIICCIPLFDRSRFIDHDSKPFILRLSFINLAMYLMKFLSRYTVLILVYFIQIILDVYERVKQFVQRTRRRNGNFIDGHRFRSQIVNIHRFAKMSDSR